MLIFGFEKKLMCTRFGGGLKKYVLYTCENVIILGWPLAQSVYQQCLIYNLHVYSV